LEIIKTTFLNVQVITRLHILFTNYKASTFAATKRVNKSTVK